MTTVENITAISDNGRKINVGVEIAQEEPWWIKYTNLTGREILLESDDLFEALILMRLDLEGQGFKLLCEGARPNVMASGMSRSMSGGRKAYVLQLGRPSGLSNLVDIFESANPEDIGTVAQQKDFYEEWLRSTTT